MLINISIKLKIGPYTVAAIETGEFALDGGAMFGVVPKVLWQQRIPVDNNNRVSLRMRALLLEGEGRTILVDNGVGHKGNEKFNSMYRIDHATFSLETSLAAYNLTTISITDVILTHLHFDHAGGSTMKNHEGTIVPTFPNATYYVQRKNYEWALKATKDRASYFPENVEPLIKAKQLIFLEGEKEIFPHIELMVFNGHTRAQQLPKISDGTTTLFFCADLFPTSLHLSLPWIMAYDNEPLVTLEEKRSLLKEAVAKKWILFFEHCPHTVACHPLQNEKGFYAGEAISL